MAVKGREKPPRIHREFHMIGSLEKERSQRVQHLAGWQGKEQVQQSSDYRIVLARDCTQYFIFYMKLCTYNTKETYLYHILQHKSNLLIIFCIICSTLCITVLHPITAMLACCQHDDIIAIVNVIESISSIWANTICVPAGEKVGC